MTFTGKAPIGKFAIYEELKQVEVCDTEQQVVDSLKRRRKVIGVSVARRGTHGPKFYKIRVHPDGVITIEPQVQV